MIEFIVLLFVLKIQDYNAWIFLVLYPLFYWIGNFLEPDSDLISLSSSDGAMLRLRQINIIIGFWGLLLAIWSMIYAWIINKHRSFWSHSIFVSTVIRVIWWNIPIFFILSQIAFYNHWIFEEMFYQAYSEYWIYGYFLAMFSALFFSDCIHIVLDTEAAKGTLYQTVKHNSKDHNYKMEIDNNDRTNT
jgi:hypothetical protein